MRFFKRVWEVFKSFPILPIVGVLLTIILWVGENRLLAYSIATGGGGHGEHPNPTVDFYLHFNGVVWLLAILSLMFLMRIKLVKILGLFLFSCVATWYAIVYEVSAGLICVDVCPPGNLTDIYRNMEITFHNIYASIAEISFTIFIITILVTFLRYMQKDKETRKQKNTRSSLH